MGAAVGEAVLGKKLGNRAMIWGLIFGSLPDLDLIAAPFLDTAHRLQFHRGASHSLLIIILASYFLAKPLSKMWKREKISPTRAGLFVFLVWSSHVLIECFTVHGTSVLWPFSSTRIAFNHLYFIDPLYTIPLVVSLIWLAFYRAKKQQKKRKKILTWGLALSSAYLAFSIGMKFLVSAAFDADLTRREITYQRRMEAPTPFNTLLWRSVVERDSQYWIAYRSVFDRPSIPIRWTVYQKNGEALAPFENEREIKTLKWFSQGWWIARPHAQGVWLADLRFGETRIFDAKPGTVDSRFISAWSFLPAEERDRLRTRHPVKPDPAETFKKIAGRIIGNAEIWEANPRLAGVPGAFPEFLPAIE